MDISIDTILNIGGWLFGGGALGGILTWKFTRRKAKAEADTAEAEADQERQNYYQQLIDDLAKDRDYYKSSRDELRSRQDATDEKIRELQMEVAKNGRKLECLRPFLCGRSGCKERICVELDDEGEVSIHDKRQEQQQQQEQKPADPLDGIEPNTGQVF